MTELAVPVIAPEDYSPSAELWFQLEEEIKKVSARIEAGEEMVPEDVARVRSLKTQVEAYVTAFNKATRNAQNAYKQLIAGRLADLGFPEIEAFIAKKREEQTLAQNQRISGKMDTLKNLVEGLLARTEKLKETPLAGELLPAFTARFPKIQSGAKNAEIKDWTPYVKIVSHTLTVLEAFFLDPLYKDAVLLPLHSATMRELLAYVRDGDSARITRILNDYEADAPLLHIEKLKRELKSWEDALTRVARIAKDADTLNKVGRRKAWEEISLIVRLLQSTTHHL